MGPFFSAHEQYHSEPIELITNQAYESCWSLDQIDWSLPVKIPEGLQLADYIDMVSQLYYAEVLTIELCARLIQQVPDFQAKRFIATQISDEARHAQGYARYITRLGQMAPINEGLRITFERGLQWQGTYCGLIVALNVILEGEALHQQRRRIDTLPCPLFKELNSRIIRDESRHAAFGILYMRDKLKDLSQEERNGILVWIRETWASWERANQSRYQDSGAAVLRTSQEDLQRHLSDQMLRLKKIGLAA